MGKAYALLRAGFPYVKTLGMRRITSNPIDLALGSEGRLYILCRGALATEVRHYTWDDEDLGTIGGPGTTDGKFLWPGAILADAEENLYVSDEGCHRISIFSRDGAFLSKWGEQGSGPGKLNRPSGLAFDPEGNIYVVDTMNHRVQKFTQDGKFSAVGQKWYEPGRIQYALGYCRERRRGRLRGRLAQRPDPEV